METISVFKGPYYFLSNFYPAKVTYNGVTYRNAEAAFQAQKDPKMSFLFADLAPRAARELGRNSKKITIRKDWEEVKYQIMYEIVECKFRQNEWMIWRLLHTGDALLIEGNTWRDQYWGVYRGKGMNKLGEILMDLRDKFKSESK